MAKPLYWFRNPKRLSDEELVERLEHCLLQMRNRTHQGDREAMVWLESVTLTHLGEIERRIAQGTLF